MKKLDQYVLTSYLGPMFLTFFIVLFVLMLQFLWLYIDELVGKGLGLLIISEFLFWGIVTFIPLALPLSTMLSSIMTMGNLGENNELLAMKAAGIPVQRIMRSLMLMACIVSISAFFVSNNLIPYANLQISSLMYDIRQKRMEIKIPEGIFYNGIENYSLRIERQNERGLMYNMIVYDHTGQQGNTSVTHADSGYIKLTANKEYMIVKLFNGHTYEENKQQPNDSIYPFQKRYFTEQEILVPLSGYDFKRSDNEQFKNQAQMKSLKELSIISDSLKLIQENLRRSYTSNFNHRMFSTKPTPTPGNTDTTRQYTAPCDSLFELLPVDHKLKIAKYATEQIKRGKADTETYAIRFEQADYPKRRSDIEWHRKFTLSIACLIFFFIGAPLGAIIRKGGLGMPAVVSIFFFVIYWVVDITGKKLSRDSVWDPSIGIWLSSFILLPIGVFLTWKATTDSALFNTERYIQILKNITKIIKKKRD